VARIERCAPGEEASDFSPGDFILAHRHHFLARLISEAQMRRFRGNDAIYAHWSHAAIIVGSDGELVEAEIMGVERNPISRYRDDEYHVVRLGPDFLPDDRARTVAYAVGQVGQAFGFLAMLGASLYLLLGVPVRLMRHNHQICSALVVRALQHGGQAPNLDPELALPADLARLYDARP
jgi:uncharacterized protein YycO